nr:hypothetical protein CFP56_37709 [Quercus suber]
MKENDDIGTANFTTGPLQTNVSDTLPNAEGPSSNLNLNLAPSVNPTSDDKEQQPLIYSALSSTPAAKASKTARTNQPSTAGSSIVTEAAGAGQSAITDDLPSCST